MKRQRGRTRNKGKSNNPNRSYDSQGPEVKVRGNPQTVYERYMQLARDAMSSGSRVRAENLFQHAEHYLRLNQEIQASKDAQSGDRSNDRSNDRGPDNASDTGEGSDDQPRSRRTRSRRRDYDDAPQPKTQGKPSAKAKDGPDEDVPTSFAPSADGGVVADVKPIKAPRPRRAKVETADATDSVEVKSTRRRRAPSRKAEPAAE